MTEIPLPRRSKSWWWIAKWPLFPVFCLPIALICGIVLAFAGFWTGVSVWTANYWRDEFFDKGNEDEYGRF